MSRELTIRNINKRSFTDIAKIFAEYGEIESINMRRGDEVVVLFNTYSTVRKILEIKKTIEREHGLSNYRLI